MPECTPGNLVDQSACFNCLTSEQKEAIKTYLLAVQTGGSTDPFVLMDSAKCFLCLDPRQLKAIQAYLLCQIANGGGTPTSCENLAGDESPNGLITPQFVGQVYVQNSGAIWQANALVSSEWNMIGSSTSCANVEGHGSPVGTVTPDFDGQFYTNNSDDGALYRATGPIWTLVWPLTCANSTSGGDPTGQITPKFVGQVHFDENVGTYYQATGLTSADWVAICTP